MHRLSPFAFSALTLFASLALAQSAPKPRLTLQQPAPELLVTDLDGKASNLATLRAANAGKILVLQFGCMTDPIFRLHNDAVEKLAAKTAAKAAFILIYQKEAHAADGPDPLEVNEKEGFNIAEPATLAERRKLAAQTVERLHIAHQTVVVDAWNNSSSLRYGAAANMTFIVDAKGNLQAGYPFMDMAKVQSAIDLLAAGKPLPVELQGATQAQGPAPFDAAAAAMDMTGGRGPATIAAVLDRITLSDAQKRAVLADIAEFLAAAQQFRQARGSLPGAPARGTPAATTRGDAAKTAAPQDVPSALATLRASAAKLKTTVQQNVLAKDAPALYESLNQFAPAQNLFPVPQK
jgi:hypothetical protein